MQRLRLTQPVTIRGKDIFGRQADITFEPFGSNGWCWRYSSAHLPVAIDTAVVTANSRRLALNYCRNQLQIYEHIGALRWTGLDAVLVSGSKWPPYFGRIAEYWQALKPYCQPDQAKNIEWLTFRHEVEFGNSQRFLIFRPDRSAGLTINIYVDFPGIGSWSIEKVVALELLEKAFEAYTLGWPPWLCRLSRFGAWVGLWSHHLKIIWPPEHLADDVLEQTVWHRLGDLLGTLSLVSNEALPTGYVVSHCAGHQHDLAVVYALAALNKK